MKTTRTILISITILSSVLLWFTGSEWFNSLSAFALSDNALFYRLMHLSASWFFMLNAYKRRQDFLIACGMGLILVFDMYHFKLIHEILTISTILFACFTIVYNSKGFERSVSIFLAGCSILVFSIGYFVESFHFLIAEIMVMIYIATAKLREIYIKENV